MIEFRDVYEEGGGRKRLSRQEYDKLVKGVDDIYFSGTDEPDIVQPSPSKKSADEQPQADNDAK